MGFAPNEGTMRQDQQPPVARGLGGYWELKARNSYLLMAFVFGGSCLPWSMCCSGELSWVLGFIEPVALVVGFEP